MSLSREYGVDVTFPFHIFLKAFLSIFFFSDVKSYSCYIMMMSYRKIIFLTDSYARSFRNEILSNIKTTINGYVVYEIKIQKIFFNT